jgi:hypothetical protein
LVLVIGDRRFVGLGNETTGGGFAQFEPQNQKWQINKHMLASQSLHQGEEKSRRYQVRLIDEENLDGFTHEVFDISASCKANLGNNKMAIYRRLLVWKPSLKVLGSRLCG